MRNYVDFTGFFKCSYMIKVFYDVRYRGITRDSVLETKTFFLKKKVVFNRNVFIWFSTLTNLPEFIKKEHKMMKK